MTAEALGISLRDQQRAFTRERILHGAAEVLAHKGYAATTIDDIVAEIGASRATFYLHFRTKRDVVIELGSQLMPAVQRAYAELDATLANNSSDAMRGWMKQALDWMAEHHHIIAAADAAGVDSGPVSYPNTLKLADQMPRYLARWPEEARYQGRTRVALLAAHFRAAYTYLVGTEELRSQISENELVDVMTDIWWNGLLSRCGPK